MKPPDVQPDDLLAELERLDPEARLARVQQAGSTESVLLALADRAMQLMHAESSRALATADLLVAIADRAGVAQAGARARHARARALAYVGRFEDALVSCHEAIDIAGRNGHTVEAGRARLASMHALGELGRIDEAIAAGHRAREEFLSVDEADFAARADVNIGAIHQRCDQPSAALEYFSRARPHIRDPIVLGSVDNNRGEALLAVFRFAEAEQAFRDALDALEHTGAAMTTAIVEGNLADLAAREGRLSRALYFFEGARRRLEATGSPAHLARLLAEQAEAKALLGLPADALDEYQAALPQLEACGLSLEAARARSGMGRTLLRLERGTEAETALAAAAAAFDDLGHATARARVDLVRAELVLQHGRPAEATRMAARALAVLNERPADAAAARHLMGRCAAAAGDTPAAEADLAAALAAAERLDLAPLLADILHTRGRLRLHDGRLDAAVDDLERAVGCIERLRGSLQAERFRTALLGDRTAVYEALVTALLARGNDTAAADAFAVAEQAKSRSLLDLLRGETDRPAGAPKENGADAALLHDVRRVESELNALYSRLADEGASADDTAWRAAVHARENELAALESRLAAGRERAWLYAPPTDIAGIQTHLREDERLLEYFATEDGALAFIVGPDRVDVVPHLAPMAAVTETLERFRFQIDRELHPRPGAERFAERRLGEVRRELNDLYEQLFAPLDRYLPDGARLTIVPHGALHLVPFHALWDGSRYVVEKHEVGTVPSAGLFAHLRGEAATAPRHEFSPLVVGVADDLATGMEAEARRAGELLSCDPSRVLTGTAATADALAALAPSASVIHVAAHGRHLPDNPFGSGLRMADRWLTLREIRDLPLHADLVTLSGCETGLSRVHAGDELIGLQRSLFVGGARALLASLWRIDDESASSFMGLLYNRWDAGHGCPPDLRSVIRTAQLALLGARPHPAHWAPFTLVGKT